ncbi:hypothetical protein C0J52_26556 [Blattella germanica]|nr:hypothetical protein C0J52_26556 [Blattella germanica]
MYYKECILKWFIKFDNAFEVERQWRREFETELAARLTIKRIIDKFEMHGTICEIHINFTKSKGAVWSW